LVSELNTRVPVAVPIPALRPVVVVAPRPTLVGLIKALPTVNPVVRVKSEPVAEEVKLLAVDAIPVTFPITFPLKDAAVTIPDVVKSPLIPLNVSPTPTLNIAIYLNKLLFNI
jgi:hypothetical protein